MIRVVSLIPSATEIVCALGMGKALVGRSHSCDYPVEVQSLPALTAPKLDPEATSRGIDERLKRLVQDGLSVYRVDERRLEALAPDVIVTQDQCEVCAASLADVQAAVASWSVAPRIVSLRPNDLADVVKDIALVADALGVPACGQWLQARLERRMERVAGLAHSATLRPRVACIEWLDPLMFAGNWVPELVHLAGGECVLGRSGAPSASLTSSALKEGDPDVLVLMPCGFDPDRTLRERSLLEALPYWGALRAVKAGQVFVVDGHHYFNRPGPRILASLEILSEILHPSLFPPRHRGTGWQQVPGSTE